MYNGCIKVHHSPDSCRFAAQAYHFHQQNRWKLLSKVHFPRFFWHFLLVKTYFSMMLCFPFVARSNHFFQRSIIFHIFPPEVAFWTSEDRSFSAPMRAASRVRPAAMAWIRCIWGVSINGGYPKSSILDWNSIFFTIYILGYHHFRNSLRSVTWSRLTWSIADGVGGSTYMIVGAPPCG